MAAPGPTRSLLRSIWATDEPVLRLTLSRSASRLVFIPHTFDTRDISDGYARHVYSDASKVLSWLSLVRDTSIKKLSKNGKYFLVNVDTIQVYDGFEGGIAPIEACLY